jgi:hypothetical protein
MVEATFDIRFGLRMQEILNFEEFLSLKIQINCKKTKLWKEKSVENAFTLEGLLFYSSMRNWDVPLMLLKRS